MSTEQQVTRHYGSAGIAARVLAALREAQGPRRAGHGRRAGAARPVPRPRPAGDPGACRVAEAAARRAAARHRLGDRRPGALDRRQIRLSCDRGRPDPGILRGGRGAERGDRADRPGPHHQRQRARPAGAGRRLRRRLFAERDHEHRRQAAVLPRGVPRAAAGRPAGAVECVRRAGRRAVFPGAVGDDRRDELSGDARRRCRRTSPRPGSRSSISATRPRPSPRRSAATASGWNRARCRGSPPTSSIGERAREMQRNSMRSTEEGRSAIVEALVRKPGHELTARTGGRRNAQNATTPHEIRHDRQA